MATSASERRLPRTIWYMGVKARVIPGFLERVVEDECPPGGTVLDLMAGTGIVSAFLADRYRVIANDVQEYSATIARSLIDHDPRTRDAFIESLDAEADLGAAINRHARKLERYFGPAMEREAELLSALPPPGRRGRRKIRGRATESAEWRSEYRAFAMDPAAVYPAADAPSSSPFRAAAPLLAEDAVERRREGKRVGPECLASTYWTNVYFGVRQAVTIDAIRVAIDAIPATDPFRERKRTHYLSALLHAASLSTSGTSHFAQPRHLDKDSELLAVARRRRIDVRELFFEFSQEIAGVVARTAYLDGNHVLCSDWKALLEPSHPSENEGASNGARGPNGASGLSRERFDLPAQPDLIYLDPPYTADHYSRFYHVLEVLVHYDWPELDRHPDGTVFRGRYPAGGSRFQSDFCVPRKVEDEFRRLIYAASATGAKLVVSYASPSGLLLRTLAKKVGEEAALELFRHLVLEGYESVEIERTPLVHSGQGDAFIPVEELLVIGTKPRFGAGSAKTPSARR